MDDSKLDLSGYRLADHEHKSGCPANPGRQEAYTAERPPRTGLVPAGTTDTGEMAYTEKTIPGEHVVVARCVDCGEEHIFPFGEH